MKIIKLLLFVLFPIVGLSQIQGEDEVYLKGDGIDAQFNGGGIEKFSEFINKNFDYAKVTKAGVLETTFAIDEMGNVSKIRITRILDIESATELIRVLKTCPKWEPAKRGGKPISIDIKYPMVFKQKAKSKPVANPIVQKPIAVSDTIDGNKVYDSAEIETKPEFCGGLKKFYEYVTKSYRVPLDTNLNEKVIVSFIVEKDGSLTDIKLLKDMGYGTGKEAIRVLRNSPKWTPAKQNGTPVRCLYNLPLSIISK